MQKFFTVIDVFPQDQTIYWREAARSDSTNYEYNRIPKSAKQHEAAEEAIKNGKQNGQHQQRPQQQDNIFHQFGRD